MILIHSIHKEGQLETLKPLTELPRWVPQNICNSYFHIMGGHDGSGDISDNGLLSIYGYPKDKLAPAITKLCTNSVMEEVWQSVYELASSIKHPIWYIWDADFFRAVLKALFHRSVWEHPMPPKKRKDIHNEIVSDIQNLASLLKQYQIDDSIWTVIKCAELDHAANNAEFAHSIYVRKTSPEILAEQEKVIPNSIGRCVTCEICDGEEMMPIFGSPPSITTVLERLAWHLNETPPHSTAVVDKDSHYSAECTNFVRQMGDYFYKRFKKPGAPIISRLTGVFFDAKMPSDIVDGTIRTFRSRQRRLRT